VKPETQNWRLGSTAQAKLGKTCGLTGTGLGLTQQKGARQVFGLVWDWTDSSLQSKTGTLAGYPDRLLTLPFEQAGLYT